MQFLALIHGDENGWESLSDDERQAIYERYMAFGAQGDKVSAAPSSSRRARRRRSASATETVWSPTAPTPR